MLLEEDEGPAAAVRGAVAGGDALVRLRRAAREPTEVVGEDLPLQRQVWAACPLRHANRAVQPCHQVAVHRDSLAQPSYPVLLLLRVQAHVAAGDPAHNEIGP